MAAGSGAAANRVLVTRLTAGIGRLRREHDGDQQRVGVDEIEFAGGVRVGGGEAP